MQHGTRRATEDMGGNLSGIQTAPDLAKEQAEGSVSAGPSPEGSADTANAERAVYIEEGFPVGSLPALPFDKEAKAAKKTAAMAVLLDKMSERLAFERMGTRLYEAFINKCETLGDEANGMTAADLQEIRDEEHRHFMLLTEAVTELGGDPTVQSPCADVAAVASMGIMQVLTDPRTTVTQSLNALLTAELTDNAGWEMLIELADEVGQEALSERFTEALDNEQRHLDSVRAWLTDRVLAKV